MQTPSRGNFSRRRILRGTLLSVGGTLAIGGSHALARLEALGSMDEKIARLAQAIEGNTVIVADPAYPGLRRAGSFNPQTDMHPALIVQCRTADDVARAIDFARNHELELAVRSGGHDVMGQSVCDGGLLLDLGLMQNVRVDSERRTVGIEAGVRGNQLEYALDDSNLTVPLACHPGVAVSGLTLGGGLGWLLGSHGTTADTATAMTLVTADGRQLRASRQDHEDLFWGLRGGGGNFGVVTALEFEARPLDGVTGGFLVYPLERLGEYLQFYREAMREVSDELMIELSIAPTHPPLLVATLCHSGTEAEARRELAPIRKFGAPLFDGISRTSIRQLTVPSSAVRAFIAEYSTPDPVPAEASDGHYNHWRGVSISEWTNEAIKTFTTCIEQAPRGWSVGIGHYMHGLPTRVTEADTPLLRKEGQSSYFFNVSWTDSQRSSSAMAWVDQSIEAMQPFNDKGTYINYLSSNSADAVQASYGSNYPRLQRLKARYDADNIFHLNRNIRA